MPVDHYIEDEKNRVVVDVEIEGKSGEFDFNTLKTGGIIKQRQREKFTVRLKCPGGRVPLEKLPKIVEVAKRYGGDYLHLSFRQSLEIPYVDYRDIGKMREELGEVGQEIASCGPRVRVPTACSGCEYNPNGLMDTQAAAGRVCEKFFGSGHLAHKFKISFSGCAIDCARSNEMDLGFQGAVKPKWEEQSCVGCELCARACLEGAIESDPDTGKPIYLPQKCLYCGDCIRACPAESWQAEAQGWMVRCSGKHGRHPIHGQVIAEFLPDQKVEEVIEAVLAWYEKNGAGKGRTRISALLLNEDVWKEFLDEIGPALGQWAVENPPPPRANEIHFLSPLEQQLGAGPVKPRAESPAKPRPARAGAKVEVEIDRQADFAGVVCPLNYVKSKMLLDQMSSGQVLSILLDEAGARSVPQSARQDGHKVLSVEQEEEQWRVLIRKV